MGTQNIEVRESVVIRFAGDSGDGMQLTGDRFTETAALAGNDIATLPDYPAEIRAPAGSIGGVSGFQVQFSSDQIYTAGDTPDVLVAMNPAALKSNLSELEPGALILVDVDQFTDRNLKRANWANNPLEDDTLGAFRVLEVPITSMTVESLKDAEGLTRAEKERSKNLFSLGLTYYMFGRDMSSTQSWIKTRFGKLPHIRDANLTALQKGYDFGVTIEAVSHKVEVPAAQIEPGVYRSITGNQATALGFAAAAHMAKRPVVQATYPITPASDILHELAPLKNHGVVTIQAEDEIAAAGMAIGASYAGAIGMTSSSGPGIALKGEAIGLAVAVELPLIVVNVQRAGPSTGMPTKVEQADLAQALYGRHGEAPLVVVAPQSASDCFDAAFESVRIATKYMTPVMLLSDGYVANSAEPWRIPDASKLPDISVKNAVAGDDPFVPFARDPETLSRAWAVPGTAGLEHRIGGLERQDGAGNISMAPSNHQAMTDLREEKIARIANDIPEQEVFGDAEGGDVLLIGWGGTYGALRSAAIRARRRGQSVSHAHIRYLSPFPKNLEEVLKSFKTVIVAELNSGQLAHVLRGKFLVDVKSFTKVEGMPFRVTEILNYLAEVEKPS